MNMRVIDKSRSHNERKVNLNVSAAPVTRMFRTFKFSHSQTANLGDAATTLALRCTTKAAASAPYLCTLCPARVHSAAACLTYSFASLDYLAVPPRAPIISLRLGQLYASCSRRSLPTLVCFFHLSLAPCVQAVAPQYGPATHRNHRDSKPPHCTMYCSSDLT